MKEATIIFKSGATTSFLINEIKVRSNAFGITGVEWDCEGQKAYPLHLNVGSIDAIIITKEETTHGK
jgi:hypothetical protein